MALTLYQLSMSRKKNIHKEPTGHLIIFRLATYSLDKPTKSACVSVFFLLLLDTTLVIHIGNRKKRRMGEGELTSKDWMRSFQSAPAIDRIVLDVAPSAWIGK